MTTNQLLPKTGDIFDLSELPRQVIVESITIIQSNPFVVVYPLSYSIGLACNKDFIFFLDIPFMAESWNSMILPIEALSLYKGSLDNNHIRYFSSYIIGNHVVDMRQTYGADVMSGPAIKSSADIRNIFQLQERDTFSTIRNRYNPLNKGKL